MRFEGLEEFREAAAAKLLMDLGNLAGKAGLAVTENRGGVGDGIGDPMRSFVKNQGAIFDAKALEGTLALTAAGREETEKEKFFIGETGCGKGGEESRRPGDGDDGDMVADSEGDEAVARVGNQGHASITDEGDVRTLFHGEDEFRGAREFVVLVIADQRLVNVEVIQKFQGVAGVLAGNLVDLFEDAEGTKSDVFEVADGCSNEVQATH